MPQLQTLVLKDRATTPVDHTFVPRDIVSGAGTVVESTGVPIGDRRFTISLQKSTAGNYKAVITFAVPVVETETVNGVATPKVVRTGYVNTTFTFAPTSSEQERKDVVGMFQSAFDAGKTLVEDTVVKLQGVY